MLAKAVYEVPRQPGLLFEPKWDGFRCIVFRDGDEVVLGSRNDRPLTRYFPEMLGALRAALPERCVVDGEIVVVTGDGLDFEALQQRIHPATSRDQHAGREDPGLVRGLRPAGARRPRPVRGALRRAAPPARGVGAHRWAPECPRHPGDRRPRRGRRLVPPLRGRRLRRRDGQAGRRRRTSRTSARCSRSSTSARPTAWWPGSAGTRTARASGRCCWGCTTTRATCTTWAWPRRSRPRAARELVDEVAPLREDALEGHPWRAWAEAAGPRRRPAHAGRAQPLERDEGPVLGAAAPRAGGRGALRARAGRPLPPRLAPAALARRQDARRVHLRPARGRGPRRAVDIFGTPAG